MFTKRKQFKNKLLILPRSFYQRDTVIVARELIGKILVRSINGTLLSGIITETEAYRYKDDPASHAFKGKTKRNAPMFGMVGCAYVYFIYGTHFCFNIVAREKRIAAGAVLIRSIEPCDGVEIMQQVRACKSIKNLANGPGKLTAALQLDKTHNFLDLTKQDQVWVLEREEFPEIQATTRIGISLALEKAWRFKTRSMPYVSF